MPRDRNSWTVLTAIFLFLWCGVAHAKSSAPAVADDSARSAPGWKPGPPRVFGYMQVFYKYAFDTGEDSLVDNDVFRMQRVRIGVKGDISRRVSYNVEFDPRAPQISTVLRDAFLRFHVIPRHQIRVGQQKTQFGYENRESSSDLFTVNRTDVSDNLSRGVNLRDIGIGVIGDLKLGKRWRLEDAVTVVNGSGMNVQDDLTARKNVWGRLGLRHKNEKGDRVARLGFSGGAGDLFDPGDDPVDPSDDFLLVFNRYGVDLELDGPRALVYGEYVSGHQEDRSTGETDEPVGWYVAFVGKTRWRVGPILRYEDFDDDFKRYTFGAYWGLPDESLRFLVNYEYRKLFDTERGDDKLYVWSQVRF